MSDELTLQGLEERVKKKRESLLARQKEHYHYARELGFSAAEAVVLQNQKKETIRKLAEERRNQDAK